MSDATLLHGDCLERMAELPDNSVDAVVTDPPYFKVKDEPWDRQWSKVSHFIEWLDGVLAEVYRVLKPNGSLYLFASPQLAARVEVATGERFNVLNRIRWLKEAGWHNRCSKESLRSYLSPWEEIIFAEHYGADNIAKGEAGYQAKCDKLRGFVFEPLRAYIVGEFERAGMMNTEGKIAANVACGFSASSGGMASRHYFSQSQWQLPTEDHYHALRELLNCSGDDHLQRDYEELREQYEELREQYEELREQYEELRRPFNVTADVHYTDVWSFATVKPYKGKHPCEKPLEMMRHIVQVSTRPGAVVLDPFMGTGATGVAASELGRDFIGVELNEGYYGVAVNRVGVPRQRTEVAA